MSGQPDSRNGLRAGELKTRIGRIILAVPRHRNVPFNNLILIPIPEAKLLWLLQ